MRGKKGAQRTHRCCRELALVRKAEGPGHLGTRCIHGAPGLLTDGKGRPGQLLRDGGDAPPHNSGLIQACSYLVPAGTPSSMPWPPWCPPPPLSHGFSVQRDPHSPDDIFWRAIAFCGGTVENTRSSGALVKAASPGSGVPWPESVGP